MAERRIPEAPRCKAIETQLAKLRPELNGKPATISEFIDLFPLPVAIIRGFSHEIIVTNRTMERLFGFKATNLWGQQASCLFPNLSERRKLAEEFQRTGGMVRGFSITNTTRNGKRLRLAVWTARIVCGGRECVIVVLVDATNESRNESQFYRSINELRRRLQAAYDVQELVASEIHDGVVQQMVGALMLVRSARATLDKDPARAREQLDAVERALERGAKEARVVMDSIRPAELEEAGLIPSLQELFGYFSKTAHLRINFQHSLSGRQIDPTIKREVYRIIQESLNNVWFHSKCHEAAVQLEEQGEYLLITVRDEGAGFEMHEVDKKCRGLRGMRLRAEMRGGTLDIKAAKGRGCTIRAALPLTAGATSATGR